MWNLKEAGGKSLTWRTEIRYNEGLISSVEEELNEQDLLLTRSEVVALAVQKKGVFEISENEALLNLKDFIRITADNGSSSVSYGFRKLAISIFDFIAY
ncbi:MAG: hypothetical protein PHG27_08805 [Massilibacteroides sp.]|nr:hypothetical protein [Massilibacteroides sp.]MDD4115673.1 hypothetical protein [Massilibacteroides sp.]MDD4659383.1 hypothetical protein [Massilibacteroides sp.]